MFKVGHMHNTQYDLVSLRRLRIPRVAKPAAPPRVISWSLPLAGWFKVNIDGSAKGCPGPSGVGGIFQNSYGSAVGSFAIPLGVRFAFKAEMMAIMTAVRLALQHHFTPLWIESDSTFVVHLVQSRSLQVPWAMRSEWHSFLIAITSLQFHISHIFREGNQVADQLANMVVPLNSLQWWPSYPAQCHHLVFNDAMGCISYRF